MKPSRRNSGSVMTLVLLVLVILLPLGLGLVDMAGRDRIQSIRTSFAIAAQVAADAGLTKAVSALNDKLMAQSLLVGTLPQGTDESLPGAEATCSYLVTGDLGTGYGAEATGRSGNAQKRVHCTLRLQGPFNFAIFTQSNISLKSGMVVDWYNYGTGNIGNQIGTNSTEAGAIKLNGATVLGDVVTGMGGDPAVVVDSHGATIAGAIYAMLEDNPLPPVILPAAVQALPSGGNLTMGKDITGSCKYDKIDLPNQARLVIKGGVTLYVVGDLLLGNAAGIQIDSTGSLTLYLGGRLVGNNSSGFNNLTTDPKKLKIYGLNSCGTISFKNSSNFYGALYTPAADVVVDNSGAMYGSFVADTFGVKNSGAVHYDASLRNTSIDSPGARFVVHRWYDE